MSEHWVDKVLHELSVGVEKYSGPKIAFALNGGKDSYVCADLIFKSKVKVDVWFYCNGEEDFNEVKSTLDEFCTNHNIDLVTPPFESSSNMKEVLKWLIEKHGITHCVDGTRKTDFKAALGETQSDIFQMTTKDWPPMTRVMPVYNWSYKQIWDYIEDNEIIVRLSFNVC